MDIFTLAQVLNLQVTCDNIAHIPIIIINNHLFISQSTVEGVLELNNTDTMDWDVVEPVVLIELVKRLKNKTLNHVNS